MRDELSPVIELLDTLDAPIDAFVRDDDAGWGDARLLTLLDTMAHAGVPIDLAAIPLAVSDRLAAELNLRIDADPGSVGVHQHGCAHANHQADGRKCEFGPARDAQTQQRDLRGGRRLLRHFFGERLQPIFTPPWNRCAAHTPDVLAELGFCALSRDRGAPAQQALPELPVDIDWSRQWREGGPTAVAGALAQALRARAADGAPLGLMLHHAVMSPAELALLGVWLWRLTRHGRLRWHPMAALLRATA